MPNYRNFKISSEQPTDIVVLFMEGKTSFEYGSFSVNHSLGFAPLVFGFWSDTADFTSPIPFSLSPGISYIDPQTYQFLPIWDSVQLSATTTNISMIATQATAHDVYYRIYAMMPTDIDPDVATTSQFAERFIINSDYNYRKVLLAGDVTLERDTTQFLTAKAITINHNLGYKPQVMVWVGESAGTIQQMQANQFENQQARLSKQGVEVTNSTITIRAPWPQSASGTPKVYYRIYYDEA